MSLCVSLSTASWQCGEGTASCILHLATKWT